MKDRSKGAKLMPKKASIFFLVFFIVAAENHNETSKNN